MKCPVNPANRITGSSNESKAVLAWARRDCHYDSRADLARLAQEISHPLR